MGFVWRESLVRSDAARRSRHSGASHPRRPQPGNWVCLYHCQLLLLPATDYRLPATALFNRRLTPMNADLQIGDDEVCRPGLRPGVIAFLADYRLPSTASHVASLSYKTHRPGVKEIGTRFRRRGTEPGLELRSRPEPRCSRAKHAKSAKKTKADPLLPLALFASWRET